MFGIYFLIMIYNCVVSNCKSVSQLLRFPRDKKLLKQWLAILGNLKLKRTRFGHIYKTKRICADHFTSEDFTENSTIMNKVLKKDAVPSLNLKDDPDKISCRAHLTTHFLEDPPTTKTTSQLFSKLLKVESLLLWSVDRNCVLLISTMSLKPELKYSSEFDTILGFQNGNCKSDQIFAEKALIFMIHGLYTNWKQLISFVYCGEVIPKEFFMQSVRDVLATCANLKFKIVATVCEANQGNINAFNELKMISHGQCSHGADDLGYESFVFDDREIIILYDASNLLKCVRDELSHSDISFIVNEEQYIANWNDIVNFVGENDACKPNMKINSRRHTQMFSFELFHSIEHFCKTNSCKDLEGTAKFLQIFTELFDSLNGTSSKNQINRPLNRTVTLGSKHWEFWSTTLATLSTMKTKNGPQPTCIQKWASTISGLMQLWRGILQRNKFKSFSPKYLQLRELENDIYKIWSAAKQKRCRLTPNEFLKSFGTTLTTYPDNRLPMCDATRPLLLNMVQYMIDKDLSNEDCRNVDIIINKKCHALLTELDFGASIIEFVFEPVLHFPQTGLTVSNRGETFPVQIVRKKVSEKMYDFLASIKCNKCNQIFFKQDVLAETAGVLLQSENFTDAFRMISIYINNYLPQICTQTDIITNLIFRLNNELDLNFLDCGAHKISEMFVETSIRYMIFTWIWKLNRCLSGYETILHQNTNIFAKQAILLGRKQKCLNKQNQTVYAVKNKNRRFTV